MDDFISSTAPRKAQPPRSRPPKPIIVGERRTEKSTRDTRRAVNHAPSISRARPRVPRKTLAPTVARKTGETRNDPSSKLRGRRWGYCTCKTKTTPTLDSRLTPSGAPQTEPAGILTASTVSFRQHQHSHSCILSVESTNYHPPCADHDGAFQLRPWPASCQVSLAGFMPWCAHANGAPQTESF